MKSFILRNAKNYPELILYAQTNSFRDQTLKVEHQTVEGYKKVVWQETNHEGNHRDINEDFVNYMKTFKYLLHGKEL